MEFDINNINEMERQRYNTIKEKGEYIEVNILIGSDIDNYQNAKGRIPVITTKMHKVGPIEIASMYMALKALTEQFENDYPMECRYGDLCMNRRNIGSIKHKTKPEEEE